MHLRDGDPNRYRRIVRTVKQVAPFFRDFVLKPELAPGSGTAAVAAGRQRHDPPG